MASIRPHRELLIDLINGLNQASVPYTALILTDPMVNTDPAIPGDTLVTFSTVPGSGYVDTVTANYTRLNLTSVFEAINVSALQVASNATTIRELVQSIQNSYGVSLFPEDVVDGPITYDQSGLAYFDLVADPASLIFKGDIMVEVTLLNAGDVNLADAVTTTILNGLTPVNVSGADLGMAVQ